MGVFMRGRDATTSSAGERLSRPTATSLTPSSSRADEVKAAAPVSVAS